MADDDTYGYGCPPEQFRFRPGESGNPFGRPHPSRSMNAAIDYILKKRMTVTERGERRMLSVGEITIKRLIQDALNGDVRAIAEVLRIWLINQSPRDSAPGITHYVDTDGNVVETSY